MTSQYGVQVSTAIVQKDTIPQIQDAMVSSIWIPEAITSEMADSPTIEVDMDSS
jgi:hypothetical protein